MKSDTIQPVGAVLPYPQGFDLLLRDELADCASKFHQLLYISRFWNPETAIYVDPSFCTALPDSLSAIASRLHTLVFEDWLACSFAEQSTEFQAYLDTLSENDRQALLRVLSRPFAREGLAPPTASQEAKNLISSNLQMLIAVAAT